MVTVNEGISRNKEEILRLRNEYHKTYQEIAEEVGVSRAYVSQVLSGTHTPRFQYGSISKVVYVGLREWMIKNKCTYKELTLMIGYKDAGESYNRIALALRGKRYLTMPIIKKILEVTGMTFEECFKEEK